MLISLMPSLNFSKIPVYGRNLRKAKLPHSRSLALMCPQGAISVPKWSVLGILDTPFVNH
jgi:hypothetical protein